ncbi:MAG: DNA/RNA nuclease SfsA [Lentisphaeria bacterium]|nr:DNA/RNA nuclease SfsA [Lentisphaeria bacterium]
MQYKNVIEAKFIARDNRFVAQVAINDAIIPVHVKNTGRCRDLLLPGVNVFLAASDNPARKTKYDLIAVEKTLPTGGKRVINIDSQAPNAVVAEWLQQGNLFSPQAKIHREVTYGKSRFDFFIEDGVRRIFLEVKGVTLENNGISSFPDAPTSRGVKHVEELLKALREHYESYIMLVIQMEDVVEFVPNDEIDANFGRALRQAAREGVKVLAFGSKVTPDSIKLKSAVKVNL